MHLDDIEKAIIAPIRPKYRLDVMNGITLCISCHNITKGREPEFESMFFNNATAAA